MDADKPFDRALRRLRRDRAAAAPTGADYLHQHAAEELLERLASVTRSFSDALVIGAVDGGVASALAAQGISTAVAEPGARLARKSGAVQCDEDRLPFADASFDLVVAVGTLDSVNDLPGALTLIRRALRPDGLFLAAFAGAGTLPRLRSAMAAADEAEGAAAPRIHPQIDLRAAGDLLARAGFTLPVVDAAGIDVRFPSLMRLVYDLRAMGATNILANRSHRPLSRFGLAAALADFQAAADPDGKTAERFEILYLTAWSPSPDQPRPARRGSATASLAEALKSKA
jgi:SAM-dependent methyltransferase